LSALRSDYEEAIEDSAAVHQRLKSMESQSSVKVKSFFKELSEKNDLIKSLKLEISNLKSTIKINASKIEEQKDEIDYLEKANKKANKISNNLNKEFSVVKAKFNKEKELILKEHKAEVKAWRGNQT
jgi:chromosome segregation ATPase